MIEISNISKKYKNFTLNSFSANIEEGKVTAIIGPNGAGKSTLLKIVCGLISKDGGEVRMSKDMRVGYLSQNLSIYSDVRLKNLTQLMRDTHKKIWDEEKFRTYFFDIFELNENQKVKELSTGMRVKYFLALELAKRPQLLLLDEPTSGLDPMIREEVLDILENISEKENVTVIFSSHITEDIEKIGDRIIFVLKGKKVLEANKDYIKRRFRMLSEAEYQASKPEAVLKMHDYYICDSERENALEGAGSDAMLADVLVYLKEVA